MKQHRCNDARWVSFQHDTSISQSGKAVDAGVNCLFCFLFFFSGLSIAWSRSSVSNDVFLHYFYETLQLHIIPLYLHSTSHAFVLTFKVSLFFFSICLGWDWRYYTCIFLLGEWCSFDFSPFGAGWVGWKTLPGYVGCDHLNVKTHQDPAIQSQTFLLYGGVQWFLFEDDTFILCFGRFQQMKDCLVHIILFATE